MPKTLPPPAPAVARALALLPHAPGIYILRDADGRVVYIGRSRDLASRVRSYWVDLKDRPYLVRMLHRVAWLEPVLCTSEHEAAFLESDLLARHRTRYNRTLGMESWVWLRLDSRPRSPSLEVRHEPAPGDGAEWFGPYLGWEPTRQAAAALNRLFPVRYGGTDLDRSDREMARSLGVAGADPRDLARKISLVLSRDAAAVRDALRELVCARDRAAALLQFEQAQRVLQQIRGLEWIVQPQKLSLLQGEDHDFCAASGPAGAAVMVIISLRAGRLQQRHVVPLETAGGWRDELALYLRRRKAEVPTSTAWQPPAAQHGAADWLTLAEANAELMARLRSASAIGPLGWRR